MDGSIDRGRITAYNYCCLSAPANSALFDIVNDLCRAWSHEVRKLHRVHRNIDHGSVYLLGVTETSALCCHTSSKWLRWHCIVNRNKNMKTSPPTNSTVSFSLYTLQCLTTRVTHSNSWPKQSHLCERHIIC